MTENFKNDDKTGKPPKKAGVFGDIGAKLRSFDRAAIKKNYIWIFLGAVLLVLVLVKTGGKITEIIKGKGEKEKPSQEYAEAVPVKAYKVKKMDFKDTLPVMGRIEGAKEVDLRFETNGVVESFNFEEGERVLEGDIIASLNQKDALLKLKYASIEMEKAKKLYELGATDKMPFEQKNLEYESAKRDLEKTNIYAPCDGYLGAKLKSVGSYVRDDGEKIGIFVDYSTVYAAFDVIEEDSSKMKLGQNVEIFLDAYPAETFKGTVDTISPLIEGRTRSQKIKVELENKENMMKPGMFARAVINTYEKKDGLIIPAAAFKKKEQKYFVYVLHKEDETAAGETKPEGSEGAASAETGGENPSSEEETALKDEEKEEAPEGEEAAQPAVSGGEKISDTEVKEKVDQLANSMGKGEDKASAEGEEVVETALVEEREIKIEYLTHDAAEVASGIKEGDLIIRELHQEFKDKDKVEIAEVQETIM
jgi:membrane fusion protein (multidrug efflux system)